MKSILTFSYLGIGLLFFILSCRSEKKEKTSIQRNNHTSFSYETIAKGKKLSLKYCQSCHLYPDPDLLPKRIWKEHVLPRMGAYNGIYEKQSRAELIEKGTAGKIVLKANVYPSKPLIEVINWKAIKAFYLSKAPASLVDSVSYDSLQVKNIFTSIKPDRRIKPPMTTMVDFKKKSGLIYQSDVKRDVSTLNIFDTSGKMIQAIALKSPAVQVREKNGALWVLTMGSFTSSDAPSGRLLRISKKSGSNKYNAVQVIIDKLRRAVDVDYGDFDLDGDEDVVIAQFGNWAGVLEWFENVGSDNYKRHRLISQTGATKVIVTDLNDDDLPDILAMIAQGDESIYAIINEGRGKFMPQKIIQVPPSYGSVYFDYVDINHDGIKDIIHVSGDNGDYTPILKPYQGIRIYLGAKDLTFTESYFFAQPGAYKAIPKDFDGDGDLDLASISFYPDLSSSARGSFIMLENVSEGDSLNFNPFTIPQYDTGRWIAMDSGDFNDDGKPDLVLGSFVIQDPYKKQSGIKKEWMANSPMFLILKNRWHF